MMQHLIALVGEKFVGKGEFVRAAQECYPEKDIIRVSSGEVLVEILTILRKPIILPHLQRLSMALNETFPEDHGGTLTHVFQKRIAEALRETDCVIFDAMRLPSDLLMVLAFTSAECRVDTVYIHAAPEIRYGRRGRGEKEDEAGKSFRQFMEEEHAASEAHIREIGTQARYELSSDDTLERFRWKCENVINGIFRAPAR